MLEFYDIEWNKIEYDWIKTLAKLVYNNTQNLDFVIIAQKLYLEWDIERKPSYIQEFWNIIKQSSLPAFIKKTFIDFFDKKKEEYIANNIASQTTEKSSK